MKRFKGFGARKSFESGSPSLVKSVASKISSPQCLPGLHAPSRESSRRRSVDGSRFVEAVEMQSVTPAPESTRLVARRRSVDDSHSRESMDLQAVRKEIWRNPLRWGSQNLPAVSSSDSFSSASDVQSSSRPSDASAVSFADTIRQHHVDGGIRATVVGFDANARETGVGATILWTFRNVVQKGDMLVLVGVLDYIRGPLGYKVQVNDQTWLGANKKALNDEIRVRNLAWSGLPGLKMLCEEAGVKLVVDVKAAARPEVAIVHEAVTLGAMHVVLDKSLHNRRRRYYLERLSCDVTRMRRSGGVDAIRSLASIASDREKGRSNVMTSPTSVIPQRPPRRGVPSAPPTEQENSFNSSLSRLVKLVEEKNTTSTSSSRWASNPTIEEDELFCIDHAFMARRLNMLLEPEPDLMDHRRDQLAMDEGYESDDLFSLAGDGASRRPSMTVYCPQDFTSQSARNSIASHDLARASLDSGPRLDKRLIPS